MTEQKKVVEELVKIRQDIDGFLNRLLEEPELARAPHLLTSASKGLGNILGLRHPRNAQADAPADGNQRDPLAAPNARRGLFQDQQQQEQQQPADATINESIGEADSLQERTFQLRYPGNEAPPADLDQTPAALPLWIGEDPISLNDARLGPENVSLATHLSANLTPLQREEVRRVCERLFAQRNDRMASLWNDLQSQNLKLHFRTASGKSFSLAGAGWQEEGDQTAQNMEETVAPEEPSLG